MGSQNGKHPEPQKKRRSGFMDPRPLQEGTVLRLLGEIPTERIQRAGVRVAAVRARGFHPESQVLRAAVICRLYPASDETKLAFARQGFIASDSCAEVVVWPEPDDDLEISLLEGFHNAYLLVDGILKRSAQ